VSSLPIRDRNADAVHGPRDSYHAIAMLHTDAIADVRAHDCADSTTISTADAAAGVGILRAHALPDFGRIQPHRGLRSHPRYRQQQAIAVSQTDERILRVSLTGAFAATVYGDLSGYVGGRGTEEGLLSATSPNFQSDGRIYVYYTQGAPAPTVLCAFRCRAA
jgi:hypothetical protein